MGIENNFISDLNYTLRNINLRSNRSWCKMYTNDGHFLHLTTFHKQLMIVLNAIVE